MEYETCDICDKQLSINKCEDFFIEDENGAHVFCEKHWVKYQKKEREKMKLVEKYSYNEFDVYCVEVKRVLTTKEITVMVDFKKNEITGDCIAYGEWYELETEECKEILSAISETERLRNFENLL